MSAERSEERRVGEGDWSSDVCSSDLKRLYMTATPRIYGDDAKSKAREVSAEIASMDNLHQFGHELHRLGFGEAVRQSLLSDYKVLVLAVDEKYVSRKIGRASCRGR